ncbi:hypothetical protein OSB04_025559 [Centaurea solstitialis]|uniref:FLZ-type domain-containing protein n=1 Tax=Centaurea solstitialis TaxID=347529 RepID=A0AA38W439_9ASTR|nr:hypothetical protein OSB04_025559 [Centaurea solstitialis]
MLLGKRQRPPMKRTTSMTEFTLDLNHTTTTTTVVDNNNIINPPVSTKIHRRNSADFIETAHFLRACHLCKRRLIPGRDIFMYRGDSAFCSLDCREKQMKQDEKKEVCSMVASNKRNTTSVATTSTTPSETLAAM